MKIRIIVIIGALLFALPLNGSAQTRNILKKKSKESTVNEKIGKGMSKLSNKLLNTLGKEEGDTTETAGSNTEIDVADQDMRDESNQGRDIQSNIMMNLLSKGGTDIKHEDSYTFNKSIKMVMEGSQTEDQEKIYFTSYYNSNTSDVAVSMESLNQSGSARITTIIDSKNNCGIMLTNQGEQKMAIITNMDDDVYEEEYEEDIPLEDNYVYNKTGRTKDILGYKCFEYKYTNNNEEGEYWLTEELDFKMDKKAIEKSGMPMLYDEGQFEGMVMMEMFAYDEEGESLHVLVTEVNTNSKQTFSLAGYAVMGIGGQVKE